MDKVDCIVIGAGVVGLAIARALALRRREVLIIEGNQMIGNETSSRNNEVLHAGFLYPPGDLRARFCRPGAQAVAAYCQEREIDIAVWGKLMLAKNDDECGMLQKFQEFGSACSVEDLVLMTSEDVNALEPEIACQAALYSPSTAVVDTHALMLSFQGDAENAGAVLALNSKVISGGLTGSLKTINIKSEDGTETELKCEILINAAGLGARDIASLFSDSRTKDLPDIFYAKGSFFSVSGKRPFDHIVVPLGATLPSGGSFTIDPSGQGKFGPDLEWVDKRDYSVSPGSASKFATAVGTYWDGLDMDRLQPGYAGIRPRTYGPSHQPGDWSIETVRDHGISGLVNLLGIETPGLTASLAVAEYVTDQVVH
ncbi:MAG TPA: FAD-dependent oxidoreductase [Sneathiellales bacterium]|nr:FAD-dependent oxidoreductase [Sneathiellales bacterium]